MESRLEAEGDCEGNKMVGLVNLALKGRGNSLDTGKGKRTKVCVCVCVCVHAHVCTCVYLRIGEIQSKERFVVVVQLLSHVRLFVALWTTARQAPLSFTIS